MGHFYLTVMGKVHDVDEQVWHLSIDEVRRMDPHPNAPTLLVHYADAVEKPQADRLQDHVRSVPAIQGYLDYLHSQ
jgi:hypothetical protein